MSAQLRQAVKSTHAFFCLDCGKCTGACPVSQFEPKFSPRLNVYHTISSYNSGQPSREAVDLCLTCGLCTLRCPADVKYIEFTRLLRNADRAMGSEHPCSHGGLLMDLMRIMAKGDMKQDRLNWVPESAKTATSGRLLYFTGCLPYYDVFFNYLEMDTLDIARSTLRLLNAAGDTPVLMENELCCGHDLYWSGDEENTARLAKRNVAAITGSGADLVVTSCPECATMLRDVYPRFVGSVPYQVKHLSEYLAEKLDAGKLQMKAPEDAEPITFHDPCRLARHMEVTDAPRRALGAVYGDQLKEMLHHGKNASCCGTSGWLHCNAVSHQMQAERLREAESTGAETLVTACPKCQIHLRCAQAGDSAKSFKNLRLRDMSTVMAEALDGGE